MGITSYASGSNGGRACCQSEDGSSRSSGAGGMPVEGFRDLLDEVESMSLVSGTA